MIPYFEFTSFSVGPVTIQTWGFFVALGILCGALLAAKRAEARREDSAHIFNATFWAVLAGIVGARVAYVVVTPEIWSLGEALAFHRGGFSATGGLVAGGAALWVYIRTHHLSVKKFADIGGPAALLGEGIGRIGCFLIHDHLGHPTNCPCAIIDLEGTPRHEVGLYLSIAGFVGFTLILALEKRMQTSIPKGWLGLASLGWYASTRLVLDFFRATDLPGSDPRFMGLTLAQSVAIIILAVIGGVIVVKFGKFAQKKNV